MTMKFATDQVGRMAYMMRSATLGGADYDLPRLVDPTHPISCYDNLGLRYWGWPDANEFGAGLQRLGKEPLPPWR